MTKKKTKTKGRSIIKKKVDKRARPLLMNFMVSPKERAAITALAKKYAKGNVSAWMRAKSLQQKVTLRVPKRPPAKRKPAAKKPAKRRAVKKGGRK